MFPLLPLPPFMQMPAYRSTAIEVFLIFDEAGVHAYDGDAEVSPVIEDGPWALTGSQLA
jgi:hypothetical protein